MANLIFFQKRIGALLAAGLATVARGLAQPADRDYRWLLTGVLALYFGTLAIAGFFGHAYDVWQHVFQVKTIQPAFADLRVLTSGFECARQGYDVTADNPCDPWGRPSPYPRIWWSLAGLGLDQSHTVAIGIGMAVLLYGLIGLFVGRLNLFQSIAYSLFLCSPTAMLLVERGNNDIVIFYLFLGAAWLLQSLKPLPRIAGYGLIYFSMMLKLFPIFGFVAVLREQPKRFWWVTGLLLALIFSYITLFAAEIRLISGTERAAEQSPNFTYGPKVLLLQLGDPSGMGREIINIGAFIIFLPALCLLIYRFLRSIPDEAYLRGGDAIHAFRLGTAIFISTSLVSVSWDYRLFFILLTLPQLMSLVCYRGQVFYLPVVTLACSILTLYLSNIPLLDEFVNLVLLCLYGCLFIVLLPAWLKPWKRLSFL